MKDKEAKLVRARVLAIMGGGKNFHVDFLGKNSDGTGNGQLEKLMFKNMRLK
jgi:hypothetical protein